MLQVHQKYENLINETFKNDPLFLSALDKACASVINSKLCDGKTTCRSAELVLMLKFYSWRNLTCTCFFFSRLPNITTVCSRNRSQQKVKSKRSYRRVSLSLSTLKTRTYIRSSIAGCWRNGKVESSSENKFLTPENYVLALFMTSL